MCFYILLEKGGREDCCVAERREGWVLLLFFNVTSDCVILCCLRVVNGCFKIFLRMKEAVVLLKKMKR